MLLLYLSFRLFSLPLFSQFNLSISVFVFHLLFSMNSYCSFYSVQLEQTESAWLVSLFVCLMFRITLSFYNVCDYEYDERLNVYHKNLLLIGDEQKMTK